jgi:hypothetical protein
MTWLNGIEIGATVLTKRSDQGQLSRFFTGFYLRKRSTKGQRNGGSIPLTRLFTYKNRAENARLKPKVRTESQTLSSFVVRFPACRQLAMKGPVQPD